MGSFEGFLLHWSIPFCVGMHPFHHVKWITNTHVGYLGLCGFFSFLLQSMSENSPGWLAYPQPSSSSSQTSDLESILSDFKSAQ